MWFPRFGTSQSASKTRKAAHGKSLLIFRWPREQQDVIFVILRGPQKEWTKHAKGRNGRQVKRTAQGNRGMFRGSASSKSRVWDPARPSSPALQVGGKQIQIAARSPPGQVPKRLHFLCYLFHCWCSLVWFWLCFSITGNTLGALWDLVLKNELSHQRFSKRRHPQNKATFRVPFGWSIWNMFWFGLDMFLNIVFQGAPGFNFFRWDFKTSCCTIVCTCPYLRFCLWFLAVILCEGLFLEGPRTSI